MLLTALADKPLDILRCGCKRCRKFQITAWIPEPFSSSNYQSYCLHTAWKLWRVADNFEIVSLNSWGCGSALSGAVSAGLHPLLNSRAARHVCSLSAFAKLTARKSLRASHACTCIIQRYILSFFDYNESRCSHIAYCKTSWILALGMDLTLLINWWRQRSC